MCVCVPSRGRVDGDDKTYREDPLFFFLHTKVSYLFHSAYARRNHIGRLLIIVRALTLTLENSTVPGMLHGLRAYDASAIYLGLD
jgi:hypothetical protein